MRMSVLKSSATGQCGARRIPESEHFSQFNKDMLLSRC